MRIDLNGGWKATEELGLQSRAGKPGYEPDGWREVPVPGHWQQAAGLTQFQGRLLFRRSFVWEVCGSALPPGTFARLHLDGVFFTAKVWFNGAFVGEHAGYFVPAAYDVTRHLRPGENVVMVEVESPPEPDPHSKRMIGGLLTHWENKPPGLEPGGIWQGVWLEVAEGVVSERLTLRAEPDGLLAGAAASGEAPEVPATATVTFELEFGAAAEGKLAWTATITPETFVGEALQVQGVQPVRKGRGRLHAAVTLPEPRLWWTWDHGEPHLYRFTLEVSVGGGAVQRLERLFGVRRVELQAHHFYLNGRRIFVRGANYGPTEVRLAAATPEQCRQDIALARGAHMNLLRVRAHVAVPHLYEEASRQGILLWQDFPLHGLYSRSVLEEARAQARAMVDLLGHWPAVGLWCAADTPLREIGPEEAGLLERGLAAFSRIAGNWTISTLAPAVRKAIVAADPTRPCLVHSLDWGGLLGSTETRLHLGWREGRVEDLDRVLRLSPGRARFVSDFGAQSFPVAENSHRFVRGEWPHINWSDLTERHMLQPKLLERHVPHSLAQTFEQYVGATQWYQSHLNRYFIERFRRLKYAPCGGILLALLTDCAPGVTASLTDYWRQPKAAYQAVKDAFSPVFILAEWPKPGYPPGARLALQAFLVNDLYRNLSGTWTWSLERGDEVLAANTQPAYLPPDRLVTIPDGVGWTVPEGLAPGAAELVLRLDLEGITQVTNRYPVQILTRQGGSE